MNFPLQKDKVNRYIRIAMKFSAYVYLLVYTLSSVAFAKETNAQVLDKNVHINLKNASLTESLDYLARQTGVNIVYTGNIDKYHKTTLKSKNESLKNALNKLLAPYQLTYILVGNSIVIKKSPESKSLPVIKTAADSILVRGRVLDQKEPPTSLPGVSAQIKGTNRGTLTDIEGFFEVYVKPGDVIQFSMVGFDSKEYLVSGKERTLTISLPENLTSLNEVVVTGFSEQKVKYLASSVSTITMNNVTNKPITQLSQALQGGTTGINVTQGSGLPGGDAASIKIRGVGSLLGSDPLVLVDGVPFDMNKLDPNTIESISILKDAAAASIYGARAGNGVIIITTKRGVAGKVDVNFNMFYGTQTPMTRPDFVDAATYMEMVNEARKNTGGARTYSEEMISTTRSQTDPLRYPSTNWGNLLIAKSAPLQQYGLTVSGGNATARFSLAANFMKQGGVLPNSAFNRGNIRVNTSVDLSKKVVVFMDLFASRDDQLQPYAYGSGSSRLLNWIYTAPPNVMSRFPTKEDRPGYGYYGTYGESWNPLAQGEIGGTTQRIRDEVLINLRPKWDLTRDLTLKGQFSYRVASGVDKSDREAYVFFDYFTESKVGIDWGTVKSAGPTDRTGYYYVGGNLDYNKNFGNHRVNILAGYSQELHNRGSWQEIALVSLFAKAYYSWNEKYLVELGMRRDGSSLFAPTRKWGNFPSVAVGWNVGNEELLKRLRFLDQFKIRGSYGMLGNNGIDPYSYQSTVSTGNGVESTIGNPNITWEKVGILDIGADIALFKRKLDLTFDWYDKRTTDLILSPQPTWSSGLLTSPVNIGSVKNTGWEIKIGYNKTFRSGLEGSFNVGYSRNRSTWLKLSQELPIISGELIRRKGGAISEYYGFRSLGLIQEKDMENKVAIFSGQQAGDVRYEDINNDGIINNDDRVSLGAVDPISTFFGNLQLKFKNIDFDGMLTGTGTAPVFYRGRIALPLNVAGEGGTPMNIHRDYWTTENPGAVYPRLMPAPGNNGLLSTFWQRNGAYVRVRYIQLGYSIPASLMQKARIRGLRLYINAQNPFTFSHLKMIDPETKGDQGTYPMFKTTSIGLNLKF